MKKIISFFNDQSKFLKIGNWWVVTVRYIISVLLIVIWIGGIHEIITTETTEHLILLMLLSIFSLLMAFIFTKLPPRTENWLKVEERVK